MPRESPTATPAPADPTAATFARDLQAYAATRRWPIGVVVRPVGGAAVSAGTWTTGVAWSTSKVPLVLATGSAEAGLRRAAIVESDNAAAMALWSRLGSPDQAATRMDAVGSRYGVRLATERRVVRPGYTPFGQTVWSTEDQAAFMAAMTCDAGAGDTLALMGSITPDHRWGLGRLPGARFKGGWGPEPDGADLQRQMGVVDLGHGPLAIALAARTSDEATGRAELDALARWLGEHGRALRAPGCPA